MRIGADAKVTCRLSRRKLQGKVAYIGAVLDKETRTVPARIEVGNADGRLKPEMFATADHRRVAGAKARRILLPEEAVVLIRAADGIRRGAGGFEPRAVEPGDKSADARWSRAGLKAGEQVVLPGTYALKARLLKSQIGDGH